jgi:hypothetical protein
MPPVDIHPAPRNAGAYLNVTLDAAPGNDVGLVGCRIAAIPVSGAMPTSLTPSGFANVLHALSIAVDEVPADGLPWDEDGYEL